MWFVKILILFFFAMEALLISGCFAIPFGSTIFSVFVAMTPTIYALYVRSPTKKIIAGIIGSSWSLLMFFFFESIFARPIIKIMYFFSDYNSWVDFTWHYFPYDEGDIPFANLVEYGSNYMFYITYDGFHINMILLASFIICTIYIARFFFCTGPSQN